MNSPAKLTDTQFAILSEASQRKDRCLIAPKTLKGGTAQKLAAKLLTAGLVREIKAKTFWRRCRRHHREPRTGDEPGGAEEFADYLVGGSILRASERP
jgi:hypothetical protein